MTRHEREGIGRRDAIKIGGALVTGAALMGGPGVRRAAAQPAKASGDGVVRLAHLSDTHVQPERKATEGFAACLAHVMARKQRPDLVITGGDLVMDAFEQTESRTRTQWDLFIKTLRDGCGAEIRHCLGNHDIWGWNKRKSATTGAEVAWGKRWAQDALGLDSSHYAFEKGAWRFIILDSVHTDGADGYIGKLDDAQFDWLERTLRDTPPGKHVCVVSHIPILSVSALFDGKDKAPLKVYDGNTMTDANRLHVLFARHGGVRLCLSGHIHQVDRADYDGVAYICDGAVSGNWWKGRYKRCDEGYGALELKPDGSFTHEYVRYGWQAAQE